jgi:hypothetical protein
MINVALSPTPVFRPRETLTKEQLTNPDYAMKQLIAANEKMGASKLNITCSKCHHCR